MIVKEIKLTCNRCRKTEVIKYGHNHGKQRYLCKNCRHQFTNTKSKEYRKIFSAILFLSGLSMSATAEILGISSPTVMNDLKYVYNEFECNKINYSNVICVEMDEMHHYTRCRKNKLWVWKVIDHQSRKLIGWEFGKRDTETFTNMLESMNFEEFPYVYADHYAVYKECVQQEK